MDNREGNVAAERPLGKEGTGLHLQQLSQTPVPYDMHVERLSPLSTGEGRKSPQQYIHTLHRFQAPREEDAPRDFGDPSACFADGSIGYPVGYVADVRAAVPFGTRDERTADRREHVAGTVHQREQEGGVGALLRKHALGRRGEEAAEDQRQPRVGFQHGMDDVRPEFADGKRGEEGEEPLIPWRTETHADDGDTVEHVVPRKVPPQPRRDDGEVEPAAKRLGYLLRARLRPAAKRGCESREDDDARMHE